MNEINIENKCEIKCSFDFQSKIYLLQDLYIIDFILRNLSPQKSKQLNLIAKLMELWAMQRNDLRPLVNK